MTTNEKTLKLAHTLSYNNEADIKDETDCGCYYCVSVFKGKLVSQWTDCGETALCPHCGIDTVIPNQRNVDFLWEAHNYWFGKPMKGEG